MDDFCPFCGQDTEHLFKPSGHERDSSNDYQECLTCHAWKTGWSDKWHEATSD